MDGQGSQGGHRRAAELTPNCLNQGFSRTFENSQFDLGLGGRMGGKVELSRGGNWWKRKKGEREGSCRD